MNKFILIVFVLLLGSCKNIHERKLIGLYTIDNVAFQNNSILHSLGANMIKFSKDGTCDLPKIRLDESLNTEENYGTWCIDRQDTTIIINSEHTVLSGKFNLSFKKDHNNKLLQIVLKNEDLHMTASKMLQNFDLNKNNW
ncbi:hypothetical protein DF185_12510 [Marinifilum breve]|uniref:Lipocalin-like domain-containing protein n=1 Tax=Marinifilum breve TaxID=2184082 RepID=A0A2V3ZVP5_9BACT|nr:hypothetical protein [Marinifilum breve]PXY00725.1 hypothetical protein DF185_12510 [Marinifilum breve]